MEGSGFPDAGRSSNKADAGKGPSSAKDNPVNTRLKAFLNTEP